MVWWNLYVVVFIVALTLGLILTPAFKKLAELTGFYDCPKEQWHKRHSKPTPLLGGLALCVSWALTIVIGIIASQSVRDNVLDRAVISNLPGISKVSSELVFICLGAVLATLLGLYDDKFNMSAKTKLAGQIAIAVLAVTFGGVKISFLMPTPFIAGAVTVFWIVLVMNSINFFDNMDGLAVGTAAIAFTFFAIVSAESSQYFIAVLAAATAGSAFGFWFYNHSPATIFMGDSGSHFLGYNLAVLGVLATYYSPSQASTYLPILIPFFILAIPLFDLCAVVVIRLRAGKPVYIGDHNHISHRFLNMGMTRKQAVLMVHLLAIAIGLSVLPLMWGDLRTTVISLMQAFTILLLVTLLQYKVKKPAEEKNNEKPDGQ
ncbi:MAG: MraY family glycosyltransferase [Victivallales bacterium]|jgi:UDP-GlcNAc:undecaprenyl-phosphate GlcNAc-1-phosphate transferase